MVLRGVDCESHCSCECWCWLLCMSPRLIFVLVLTSGAANNTAHIPGVDQRCRQLWNEFGRYFIYTHTLTVNYHNIHSSARCSAYEKYDIWWSLAASPGWRLCGVRLAALHRVWMKTHRESGEGQWAVSSQARDFYTNSCLTCHENKAANKRNHPQDTRGNSRRLQLWINIIWDLMEFIRAHCTMIRLEQEYYVLCVFDDDGRYMVII